MNPAYCGAVNNYFPVPENHPSKNTTLFPSVCSRTNRYETNSSIGGGDSSNVRFARLFLLSKEKDSKDVNKGKDKIKRSKNRKYQSHSETIKSNDDTYKINADDKHGIYPVILKKIIQQLDICLDKWVRVFVFRFDLHQKHYTKNSTNIRRFIKNLKRRIEREYDLSDIGYLWVREQERAKAQHYHCVIFLDGDKIRHSSKLLKTVESTWKNIAFGNHVPVIKNPFYFIDNKETKADAIYRISYLAKTRGKGYKGAKAKDYSTSRLTPKIRTGTPCKQ